MMSKPPLGKLFLIIKSICNARNDHSTTLKRNQSLLFVSCNTRKIRLKKYFQKYVNAQTKNRFEVQQKDIIRVFGNLFFKSSKQTYKYVPVRKCRIFCIHFSNTFVM